MPTITISGTNSHLSVMTMSIIVAFLQMVSCSQEPSLSMGERSVAKWDHCDGHPRSRVHGPSRRATASTVSQDCSLRYCSMFHYALRASDVRDHSCHSVSLGLSISSPQRACLFASPHECCMTAQILLPTTRFAPMESLWTRRSQDLAHLCIVSALWEMPAESN